ncbi:MAG: AAA family ATPase, partial [Actinobacteria bacterium]|nr:AAA family ATPase [Actinomycetota bacterium]
MKEERQAKYMDAGVGKNEGMNNDINANKDSDIEKNSNLNRNTAIEKDVDIKDIDVDKDTNIKDTVINRDADVSKNIDKPEKKYFGRVIAIANQKGGVGKSTTAVNMSSCLGDLGYKTLLIDLDPQSNSTSGLGITREQVDKNIYDILISNEEPQNAILKTPFDNLYIIPSSIQLAGAEVELVSTLKREYKLQHTIEKIKQDFDFIIIDCPPALGLLTINALTVAAEVLIPIQCEYYALEGLGQLINTINLVRENLNEKLIIAGVVMTMYDQRTKLSEQVIDEGMIY